MKERKFSSVHYFGLATILLDNLNDDYGFVIGRADKRYTLWKYNKQSADCITIKYVQVLSDKRHRVEQRFPEVFICEELRGEHRNMTLDRRGSSKSSGKPASAPKTLADFIDIPFGTFRGMKMTAMSDWQWCKMANYADSFKWTDAWGEEFDFEPLVLERLAELGCEKVAGEWFTEAQLDNPKLWMYLANTCTDPEKLPEYEELCRQNGLQRLMGRWFPMVAIDDEKPWMTTAKQILPFIEKGEPFSFVAHFNGNGFWFGLPVEFREEDKKDVYTYYGSSHFLLVTDKKGNRKAKRVKGKTIEVLEYEVNEGADGKPFVLVNKFNII